MATTAYRSIDLGEPLAVHRFTTVGAGRVLALCFMILPLAFGLLPVLGIIPWGNDWNAGSYIGCAVLFLGMPALGLKVWLEVSARAGDVVSLHDRGLTCVDKGKARSVAWEEVESLTSDVKQNVSNGIPGPVVHIYTLATPSGPLVFTHGYEDVERLAALLKRKTAEVIEPRLHAQILAGEKVHVGPLSLSAAGLKHRKETLPWADASARFEAGFLVVSSAKRPGFCRSPVAAVPNAHVLAGLMARMRG